MFFNSRVLELVVVCGDILLYGNHLVRLEVLKKHLCGPKIEKVRTNKPAPEESGEARTPGLTLEGIRSLTKAQGVKHGVSDIGCVLK